MLTPAECKFTITDKGAQKGFYDWSDPRKPAPRDLSHYVVGTAEQMAAALK